MRCLIIAPPSNISDSIFKELRARKIFAAELFATNLFYFSASYLERKIHKLGWKNFELKHNRSVINQLGNRLENFQPDFILVLNGRNVSPAVQNFIADRKIILWTWDAIKSSCETENFLRVADEIFCFEHGDLNFLPEKIPAHYLPLGANEKLYYPAERAREIDVSFIGLASKLRLELLEKVCAQAVKSNWAVKIGGIFYDTRHFWKKLFFARRYPNLAKFLENRIFSPEEVAELYRRSKICLNVNTDTHKSLSPRTFEICATKSFQLMNSGQEAHGLMNLETDLTVFNDAADLLQKIEFYLAHDDLREKIAAAGYASVMKNCTLKKSVEKLLAESKIIQEARK